MARAIVRTVEAPKPALGKHDWLSVALRMLVRDGVDAVQITRLARVLEVTRGSFYWHFKDRADLLDSILEEWRAANSGVIAGTLANTGSLTEGVLALFKIWVDDETFSPLLDQAIRDWARRSEHVKSAVRREERDRVLAIARFFEKHGYGAGEAFVRARVIYFTQVGYYALNIKESMTTRMELLEDYYRTFTGREIDPALAAAFRRDVQAGDAA